MDIRRKRFAGKKTNKPILAAIAARVKKMIAIAGNPRSLPAATWHQHMIPDSSFPNCVVQTIRSWAWPRRWCASRNRRRAASASTY